MANNSLKTKITPSKEDYLRILYELSPKGEGVRSIDIANKLSLSRPSVSRAMAVLRQEGYINMEKYGVITLTQQGLRLAAEIERRHELIRLFLVKVLGVGEQVAEEDSCRMAHTMHGETVYKLNCFLVGCLGESCFLSSEEKNNEEANQL